MHAWRNILESNYPRKGDAELCFRQSEDKERQDGRQAHNVTRGHSSQDVAKILLGMR
jgi:hypothetical protein